MQKLVIILVVASLTTFACDQAANAQVKKITSQELVDLMEKEEVQLVDVRTPEETENGMIAGAQNINFRDPDFKENISKLDKNKPVAVYCGAGGRSGKTSEMLKDLGFKEIYDLSGGFSQWQDEEFPVYVPD